MYLELCLDAPCEQEEDSEFVNCEFCDEKIHERESYFNSLFPCLCIDCLKILNRRTHE